MSFDVSSGAGHDTGGGLLPKNQLAFATITKAEVKTGQSSGKRYVALEMVINPGQPFERCHLWHNLMDPTDSQHNDTTKQIAMANLAKILEVGRGAGPNNADGYKLNSLEELAGLTVAVKVGIEAGRDGYEDKNKVDFLTMNPQSSTKKHFDMLKSGVFNTTADGGPARTTGASTGGFGNSKPEPQDEIPFEGSGGETKAAAGGSGPGGW